jgi:hypothetical protein
MPAKMKNKKKRRPADRDSSDAEADKEQAVPSNPPSVEPKSVPAKTSKKAAKRAAADDAAPAAKKAKVEKAVKEEKIEKSEAPVSEKDKEALIKEAVSIIEEGIAKPDAQKGGKAFIPVNWSSKFKNALGKYRKFINSRGEFVAIDTDGGNFVVKRASDAAGEVAPAGSGKWKKLLYSAWIGYCEAVPKAERDFQKFIAEIPQKGKSSKGQPEGSPKTKAQSSPKVQPKADPIDAVPAEPKVASKLKKKKKAAK